MPERAKPIDVQGAILANLALRNLDTFALAAGVFGHRDQTTLLKGQLDSVRRALRELEKRELIAATDKVLRRRFWMLTAAGRQIVKDRGLVPQGGLRSV